MIKIGILGNGTVGSGVVELIERNKGAIKERIGEDLVVTKILVKDPEKHRKNKYFSLITNNQEDFFQNDPDVVVELIGGLDSAYDYIKKSLMLRKHVVTANKNVISKYGAELLDTAKDNGVALGFEASVGGGMPIINMLSEGLIGNNIYSIKGILNGTTNFILSKMDNENMGYENALSAAQKLGFAEAEPSADVLGYDAARKLAIASSISYGKLIDWEDIYIEGIEAVDEVDFSSAKAFGNTIKLLAISERAEDSIYAAVRPVIVPKASNLGKIQNEFNGVVLEGDATGEIFLSGKGAGSLPTASAVMSDILSIIENSKYKQPYLGSVEASVVTEYNKKATWLLRLKYQNRSHAISTLSRCFSKFYVFNRGNDENELVAFIESDCERVIDELKNDVNILSFKKILSLSDFNY